MTAPRGTRNHDRIRLLLNFSRARQTSRACPEPVAAFLIDMTEPERPPVYTAGNAANVVIAMAVAAGLICGIAGALRIRAGETMGWPLLALSVVPVALAILIKVAISRK
jgi:hypothetical protein